ncbi:MAG: hypothetical protein Fur0037_26610 [Planctomycetota bacterium]
MRGSVGAAALLLAAGLAAQERKPPPGEESPLPQGEYVLVDRVDARVGEDPILRSEVLDAAAGDIRVRESELGRPLTPAERQIVLENARERLIDQHALAGAARTLGVLPADRIETILKSRLAEAETEQVRQFGTMTRFAQALSRQHRTWESWRRDTKMVEELRLARELAVVSRVRDQANLFLTPWMMREFYERRKELYVYETRGRIDVLRVGIGSDEARARELARKAARIWRESEIDSRAVAQRCEREFGPGSEISSVGRIFEISADTRVPFPEPLAGFATRFVESQPLGAVSDPQKNGTGLWLIKIVDKIEGRNAAFEDPEVQADIRQRLEAQLYDHLAGVAVRKARERTQIERFYRVR